MKPTPLHKRRTDIPADQKLLWEASVRGDLRAVRRALRHKADVEAGDLTFFDTTALMYAARAGHLNVVHHLISVSGAVVDARNSAGCTALSLAVGAQRAWSAIVCLAFGADPSAANCRGVSPSQIRSSGPNADVWAKLFELTANASVTAALRAVARDEALPPSVPTDLCATFRGYVPPVPEEIFSITRPSSADKLRATASAEKTRVDSEVRDVIRLLTAIDDAVGSDPPMEQPPPPPPVITDAMQREIDADNMKRLLKASIKNDHTAVLAALKQRVNPNMRNPECVDNTPMHYAASQGSVHCMVVLFRAGGLLNLKNKYSYTPLHQACSLGKSSAAAVAVCLGADTEVLASSGRTPFESVSGNEASWEKLLAFCQKPHIKRAVIDVVDGNPIPGLDAAHAAKFVHQLASIGVTLRVLEILDDVVDEEPEKEEEEEEEEVEEGPELGEAEEKEDPVLPSIPGGGSPSPAAQSTHGSAGARLPTGRSTDSLPPILQSQPASRRQSGARGHGTSRSETAATPVKPKVRSSRRRVLDTGRTEATPLPATGRSEATPFPTSARSEPTPLPVGETGRTEATPLPSSARSEPTPLPVGETGRTEATPLPVGETGRTEEETSRTEATPLPTGTGRSEALTDVAPTPSILTDPLSPLTVASPPAALPKRHAEVPPLFTPNSKP